MRELERKYDTSQRDLATARKEISRKAERIRALEQQSNDLSWELTAIKATRGWRLLTKLREICALFLGSRQQ